MLKFWLNNNKVVINSARLPILCEDCPCEGILPETLVLNFEFRFTDLEIRSTDPTYITLHHSEAGPTKFIIPDEGDGNEGLKWLGIPTCAQNSITDVAGTSFLFKLFQNDLTIDPATTDENDFTEASFSGYSTSYESDNNEPTRTLIGDYVECQPDFPGSDTQFEQEHNGGPTSNNVYGIFLTKGNGDPAYFAKRLDPAPQLMDSNGDKVVSDFKVIVSRKEDNLDLVGDYTLLQTNLDEYFQRFTALPGGSNFQAEVFINNITPDRNSQYSDFTVIGGTFTSHNTPTITYNQTQAIVTHNREYRSFFHNNNDVAYGILLHDNNLGGGGNKLLAAHRFTSSVTLSSSLVYKFLFTFAFEMNVVQ